MPRIVRWRLTTRLERLNCLAWVSAARLALQGLANASEDLPQRNTAAFARRYHFAPGNFQQAAIHRPTCPSRKPRLVTYSSKNSPPDEMAGAKTALSGGSSAG